MILNWNGWRDTVECLDSLFRCGHEEIRVIIVDNGSTDGSLDKIEEWKEQNSLHKDKVIVLPQGENLGFARGNNVGIRYALEENKSDHILVLNNDTTVEKGFLQPLIDVFDKYSNVGLSGPKIIDYYTKKHWQGVAPKRIGMLETLMFFTPLKHFFIRTPVLRYYLLKGKNPRKVYGIAGCCMLFRAEVIKGIGMFDESTFLGWEEYIIAEKLMQKGYSVYAVPESVIYHKVSSAAVKIPSAEKSVLFLKSELYFQKEYLKMPYYQRLVIKIVRSFFYLMAAAVKKDYRQNLMRILEILFEAAGV